MKFRRFSVLTLTIIFILNSKNGAAENQINNIANLLSKFKPPYIAVFYPGDKNIKENDLNSEIDESKDITPDIDSLDPPYDQKAYLLYHVLRTTEEREQIDPEAARYFERTKDILRQALRKRCYKLTTCFNGCPKRVYIKCTLECTATYDDYGVCQKIETSCKLPKCGKTLPPSW